MFPPELPPIKNRALYTYRVFAKWLSFFLFGIFTLTLLIFIFPPMRLMLHPKEKFKKSGRRFISSSLSFFVRIMHMLKIVNLETLEYESFRKIRSKIIAANHPSLLDIIMLLSLIPNADCIVNTKLNKNIVGGVIRQLYIFNSLDFDDLLKACCDSLNQGNCLVIFPEGTRTPRTGKIVLKKGLARIALVSGCGILPVHIGGTDKYGLGKKEPWAAFNPVDRYIYKISMEDEMSVEKYKSLPMPLAVRALTKELYSTLFLKA
jgi:1-acyl-sn-glycerol-3-phosphate acyltransferase